LSIGSKQGLQIAAYLVVTA